MKRMLVSAAVAAAAFVPVAPAHAEICVTNNGQDVVCVRPEEWIASHEPICVTHGGRPVACV